MKTAEEVDTGGVSTVKYMAMRSGSAEYREVEKVPRRME